MESARPFKQQSISVDEQSADSALRKWLFSTSQKNKKNHIFSFSFLIEIFTANFSPSPSLAVNLFALIRYSGRATASRLVYTDLASIFNITSALHAGK